MGRPRCSDKADNAPPSAADIERIGRAVLAGLPEPFRSHVRGVVIRVQDFPDDQTLAEMGIEDPFDLLGLYHGVPVGHGSEFAPPRQDVDMIFLYRRPLLDYWCDTGEPLADIVRNTLIHEIGHHFGYSDDDMDEIEFGAG
ncbi:MAG TPA: metallopeptidase family protein [Geminicoccaceae bacterium]|jgi:predicted Zn-dependent protease with MMP-like domain|nr:metallopeptidase family protein [Geminicoccaceae bacterium]